MLNFNKGEELENPITLSNFRRPMRKKRSLKKVFTTTPSTPRRWTVLHKALEYLKERPRSVEEVTNFLYIKGKEVSDSYMRSKEKSAIKTVSRIRGMGYTILFCPTSKKYHLE